MSIFNLRIVSISLTRIGYLVFVGAALAIAACSGAPPQRNASTEPDVADSVEVDEVYDDSYLQELENQTIVLYGSFKEDLGNGLFLVDEERNEEMGDVLILNESTQNFTVPESSDIPIWIVGEVKSLSEESVENPDQFKFDAYEGQLVVHADRIALAPSPGELVENADTFYDQEITVYGAVEPVRELNAFVLESPGLFEGDGIITILNDNASTLDMDDGDKVAVSGTLQPYVYAHLEEEYGLGWEPDMREQLESEYGLAPVLIAKYISLIPE